MFKNLMLLCVVFLFLGSSIYAQEVTVEDLLLCTGVEERQPVAPDTVFQNDVGRVYCFSKIVGITDSTSVYHAFYHNDVEMAKIELTVKGTPWRTWSYKTIMENWLGDWRVDVIDAEGNVLKTAKFKIKK